MMKNIFPDAKEQGHATAAICEVSKQMTKAQTQALVCIGGDFQYILNHPHNKIAYGATAHCKILLATFLKYRDI